MEMIMPTPVAGFLPGTHDPLTFKPGENNAPREFIWKRSQFCPAELCNLCHETVAYNTHWKIYCWSFELKMKMESRARTDADACT